MIPYTIKNQEGKSVSPMTSTKTVFDDNGVDLDTLLAQIRGVPSQVAELAKAVEGKQDALKFSDDFAVSEDSVAIAERAKLKVFDDMWATCAGSDGSVVQSGVKYSLNGLEVTLAEARVVVRDSIPVLQAYGYAQSTARTFFRPSHGEGSIAWENLTYTFYNCPNLEVLNLGHFVTIIPATFYRCPELKTITASRVVPNGKNGDMFFSQCPKLTDVHIDSIRFSLSLAQCPLLSLASLSYLVNNAANELAITVTVHADVYAKLTGDTTNAACAALTEEERTQWAQVLADANAKDISFATL